MDNGWRRETTIREYTKSGIRGEVVYVAPCGKKFKQYPDIIRVSPLLLSANSFTFSLQYLEKRGVTNIKRENFSFSTKLIVGDFLRPSGQVHENGEEAYHRYTEHEMGEEIDKVRRENGWKPRKRNKPSNSTSSRKSNGTLPLSLENMGGTVQEQYQFLQRLQAEAVERDKRKREEQEQVKLQKEAMR